MINTTPLARGLMLFGITCSGFACSGSDAGPPGPIAVPKPAPFLFRTSAEQPVAIQVREGGRPVVGCAVQIRAKDYGTVLIGMTDASGGFTATAEIPGHVSEVAVTMQVPGLTGPFPSEALRASMGPFAPSALLEVPPGELADLSVELTKEAP